MRLFWILALCFVVVDISAYALRAGYLTVYTAPPNGTIEVENESEEMMRLDTNKRWFSQLALSNRAGTTTLEMVGTVHTHIVNCTTPESASFSCLKTDWEKRFREGLGNNAEYCDIILSDLHRELCLSSMQKKISVLQQEAPPLFPSNILSAQSAGLSNDEFDEALHLLKDGTLIRIKDCPTDPALSTDCLEASWQLAFKKHIPLGRTRYCDLIPNEKFRSLCHTGVAIPLTDHITELLKYW